MSNYGSMPPPGPYTAPGAPNPNQNAQQQQAHQPGPPSHGNPAHAHKPGGAFGQMMNQAVTTGKPILGKLGKTISSKLGGKQPAGGPPQHLQSYSNYQQHQGQGQQGQPQAYQQQHQQQGHTYSPQLQQQQWQQPQQPPPSQQPQQPPPPAPNTYTPQPSPYQQSNYATPVSAHSGQSNYFPNQQQQPNAPPPGTPNYNSSPMNQGGNMGSGQQGYNQQGQFGNPGMAQQQFQLGPQPQAGQHANQQTGVVGSTPGSEYHQNPHTPHMGDVSPEIPPNKPAMQPQWSNASGPEQLPPASTQQKSHSPMPPQQYPYSSGPPQQPHPTATSPSPQQDNQQWNPTSPLSPQGHAPSLPPPHSPPPQQIHSQPTPQPAPQPHPAPNVSPQPSPVPKPSSLNAAERPSQTEFIAELPADMGNMSPVDSKPGEAQYQAYQPQGTQGVSPTNRFSIARRTASASSLPIADPWRLADPMTEQPTREFYMIADLLFDALDRKFEPHNTGMLEAPKVLRSWVELTQDAHRLFAHDNYTALARMWSLEGIPHMMVPVQPSLTPILHFNQHSHAQDLKVVAEPQSTYAMYVPALNRAGWYKFFFLEMNAGSDDLGKLLTTLCQDTYKPGVLNQPDLNRRDKSDIPALRARAAEVQSAAIRRVCEEASAALMREQIPSGTTGAQGSSGGTPAPNQQQGSAEEMARLMHEIQIASNDMAVQSLAYQPAYSRLV